jgi:8-hydroxy-5-deazaflavin:NADPH oxidoreductase
MKPTIGILGGTGHEGKGLALRWAHAGYRVVIGSRDPERARTTGLTLIAPLSRAHEAAPIFQRARTADRPA